MPTSPLALADTDTDVSLLADIGPTAHMLDSFEIENNPIDYMPSPNLSGKQMGEEASVLHAPSHSKRKDNEAPLMKEGRTGIRTRNHFQPSPEYVKVWEDITPPSAAAKRRHLAVKAKSKRSNEQISSTQALLKTPTGSAGKVVLVQKEIIEAKRRKVVCRSSPSNSDAKSHTRVDTPITPTDLDVQFGRGGESNVRNKKFHLELTQFINRYRQGTRTEKTIIAIEVVNAVKGYGGRFLALDKGEHGGWYEVDDRKARTKVGQGEYTINCL